MMNKSKSLNQAKVKKMIFQIRKQGQMREWWTYAYRRVN